MQNKMTVVGGESVGSEAAWQLAAHRMPVWLFEMRPARYTSAHSYPHIRFAGWITVKGLRYND